jgi:hypothetical protein
MPEYICQIQFILGKKIMKFITNLKLGFGCAAIAWNAIELQVICWSQLTLPRSLLVCPFAQKYLMRRKTP